MGARPTLAKNELPLLVQAIEASFVSSQRPNLHWFVQDSSREVQSHVTAMESTGYIALW
jgi:hypothetical protein